MSMHVVDAMGRNILTSPLAASDVSIVWHAGEPTTVPIAWYEEAFGHLAAVQGVKVHHSFQTNGIAINSDWIDLWRRWSVRVGVSIDGPRNINDRHRRTKADRGSFDAAMAGLRRLRVSGYPFHVISVLTRRSLDCPNDLMDFYENEGITHVGFNIEEKEGEHRTSSLAGASTSSAYGAFLRQFVKRMQTDLHAPRCREVDAIKSLITADSKARRHNPQANPLEIVSVAVNGDMSTYSPELMGVRSAKFNNFIFGNVLKQPVEAILEHPAFLELRNEIERGISACEEICPYFGVCGGGVPANKFFEHNTCASTETMYCRLTRKLVIDTVLPELEAAYA